MKVIATYGPNLVETGKLDEVCKVADVLRINISHQLADEAEQTFNMLKKYGKPIMIDTSGPEVRVKAKRKVDLKAGDKIKFGPKEDFDFDQEMFHYLKEGDSIYMNDGIVELKLVEKTDEYMVFEAVDSITVKNRSGINLKGRSFQFPILKPNDEEVLKKLNPNYVALSYTRNVDDIKYTRKLTNAKIVAKIENYEGIKNIEDIIKESDAVMVARGDLGVEIPPEEVPVVQKKIINLANKYAKPVIVATQVLYSMVENPVPTRAEVSDIATSVLDGADAIMLSNETAVGKYPLEAINVVKKVSENVEKYVDLKVEASQGYLGNVSEALSQTLKSLVKFEKIDKIIVVTRSGFTSRIVSRFKINRQIIAFTESEEVAKDMNLQAHVIPTVWERPKENIVPKAALSALERGLIKKDDIVVFIAAVRTGKHGGVNMLEIHHIGDLIDAYNRELES